MAQESVLNVTEEHESPRLNHVVFAVAYQRQAMAAQLFSDLGFTFECIEETTDLGLRVQLDWDRGVELISPIPDSSSSVAARVNEFLERYGDGVYTVVLRVPGASAAATVAERYGATVRFRQNFEGDGTYLNEIDLSVLGLPITFLSTNVRRASTGDDFGR